MLTRSRGSIIAVVAISLLVAGYAAGQETEALFLPQDRQLYDDTTVAGVREQRLSAGLSRLIVPGSDAIYYVVDEVAALRGNLREALADIYRNDSDISIGTDQLRSDFIHLRVRTETRDARYITVEPALLFQANEFFRAGGYSNDRRSIEVLEYQFPIESCSGLGAAIEQMETLFRDSVSGIVPREPPRAGEISTVSVDGASYSLRVRLGLGLHGAFGISQNNGALFDAVRSIRTAVRECSGFLEPEVKAHDF